MKNQTKKFKSGELQDAILESIADFLIEAGGPIKPRLHVIIGELIKLILKYKRVKIREKNLKRALKRLEKKEIISLEGRGDKVKVYLQEEGKATVMEYSIKAILDFKKKEKKWQGKWFLVFFDVPEIQRNKRDYLRDFLRKLGFYRYQKSVYVFPYECKKEIFLIKKIVEGAKYMKYIVAEELEDEEMIKTYFRLDTTSPRS
jgi:CRISPR-associated endonuclease Cas2